MTCCRWCDDPTDGGKLCPSCAAYHAQPLTSCDVPGHELPTRGPRCAECERAEEQERVAAERRAADLQIAREADGILSRLLGEGRWSGCEFGKAHVGNALLNVIRDAGGVPTLPAEWVAR